jgi:hypothetical protein
MALSVTDPIAIPGLRLPGAAGQYMAVQLALSLATGISVLAYNAHQTWARSGLAQQRGRTLLSRPVVVVTNMIAVIMLANTLICALGESIESMSGLTGQLRWSASNSWMEWNKIATPVVILTPPTPTIPH